MLKSFKRNFKKIDLFGAPIKFNIDGYERYQSAVGAFATLIMLCLIGLCFQNKLEIYFKKLNIRFQTQEIFSANPMPLTLNQNNFMFAVAIEQDPAWSYASRPYYLIEMTQDQSINQNKQNNSIKVPLKPCKLESFKNFQNYKENVTSMFERLRFDDYLCPTENFTLYLQGSYLSDVFNYVTIRVKECRNDTSQNSWNYTCAPQTEIDRYYNQNGYFRLNLYSNNFVINPELFEDFSQPYISEDLNFQFQPGNLKKSANIFFSNYQVFSDTTLWVTNQIDSIQNYIFREKNSLQESIISGLPNNSISKSLSLYLRSDYYQQFARRRYMKIDELLSYFGGIFQLFFLFFGLVVTFYNDKHFLLRLANKLYEFKELKDHLRKKLNRTQNFQLEDQTEQTDYKQTNKHRTEPSLIDVIDFTKIQSMGFKNRKEFFIWYFQRIFYEKQKLRITCTYFFYYFTYGKLFSNQYNQLVDLGVQKVRKQMNIKNMLNQMVQVDKMKKILMDDNQITLFNYIAKPELNLQDKLSNQNSLDEADMIKLKKGKVKKTISKKELEKYQNLLKAFERVLNMKTDDESMKIMNKKLVHFLGAEIRKIFRVSLLIKELDNEDKSQEKLERKLSENIEIEREIEIDNEEVQQLKVQYVRTIKPKHLIVSDNHQELENQQKCHQLLSPP